MSEACRDVSVLIVDAYPTTRRRLATLLHDFGMRVVGEAGNACEAVQRCALLHPRIVVLDVSRPLLNGYLAARRIAAVSPASKVILLSVETCQEYAREALRVGALGFVSKQHAGRELLEAVEAALQGNTYVSRLQPTFCY